MRRWVIAAVVLGLLAVALWPTQGLAQKIRGYQMRVYSCTDQRSGLAAANPQRAWIRLLNLGRQTVILGGSVGAHVSGLTGYPLHAAGVALVAQETHALTLQGGGQVECIVINVAPPATVHVGVIEAFE